MERSYPSWRSSTLAHMRDIQMQACDLGTAPSPSYKIPDVAARCTSVNGGARLQSVRGYAPPIAVIQAVFALLYVRSQAGMLNCL